MKPITLLFVLGLLLLAPPLFGQTLTTSFSPATTTVQTGQPVALQLRVTNFTNVASIQLPIAFNKTVLQFDSIGQAALPGFNAGNYLPPATANSQGRVTVSWFPDQGAYPNGFSVSNNTAIFTLYFKALTVGTSTVNLSTAAPGIEVINSSFLPMTVSYQSGGNTTTVDNGGNPPGGTCVCPTPPVIPSGLHFYGQCLQIPQGGQKCMPVKTDGFTNMLTTQFVIHFNEQVLEFVKIQGINGTNTYGLQGISPTGSFNTLNANTTGDIPFIWYDDAALGKSVPNGTTLFEVCFKAIGDPCEVSDISFDGVGLPPSAGGAEATNTQGTNLWNSGTPLANQIFVENGIQSPPVTFIASKDTIAPGEPTCIPIKVKDFNDVVSAQFSVQFDPTKLTYQSINLGANPLGVSLGNNFNVMPANLAAGQIGFFWDDAVPPLGLDLADNTTIFSVCFTTAANATGLTPVTFGDTPVAIEVALEPGGPTTATMTSGSVLFVGSAPVAQATATPACNGANNGAITLTTNFCTSPTYAWSGGQTTKDIANLAAGTYTVIVTCSGGATITASATVNSSPAITATPVVTNVTCPGGADGAITINPGGGSGSGWNSFTWNGNPGTATATSLSAGTYNVTFRDGNNCQYTSATPITVSAPAAFSFSPTITHPTCANTNNGSISVVVTGGSSNYTFYSWSSGFSTPTITGLGPGQHVVSVTDNLGCTGVSPTYTVSGPPAISAGTVVANNVKCKGANDGSIMISPSGGTGALSFNWSSGSSAQNLSNLAPGSYNLTITDGLGCSTQLGSAINIAEPSSILSLAMAPNSPACAGSTASIGLTVSGGWNLSGQPYSYLWSNNSTAEDVTGLTTGGTYTVTVTDIGGCTATASSTVTVPQPISYTQNPAIQPTACGNTPTGSIQLFLQGGNGNYVVNWSNGMIGANITGLAAGSYTPTVTYNTSCTAVLDPVVVGGQATLGITSTIDSLGGATPDGSITLNVSNGSGTYSYAWTGPTGPIVNNSPILLVTAPGTYTVTITDAQYPNCPVTQTYTMDSDAVATAIAVPACSNDGCLYFIVSFPGPYLVSLNNTSYTVAQLGGDTIAVCGLAPGFYNPVIATNSVSVTLPAQQITQAEQPLFGNQVVLPTTPDNGAIFLNAVAGSSLSYNWSNGSTSSSLTGLPPGAYTVTVTNTVSQCTVTQTFTLPAPPPTGAFVQPVQPPTCSNLSNGAINLNVQAVYPVTYQWSGPGITAANANLEDQTGLPAGTYTVTVTQPQDGQTFTLTTTLIAQSNLAITNVNETSVYGPYQVSGACDGQASVVYSGQSNGPVSVLWDNGATSPIVNNLCGGAYSVTVTDFIGCVAIWTGDLTAPPALVGTTQIDASLYNGYGVSCNGACDGEVAVKIQGGFGNYRIQWPANVPGNPVESITNGPNGGVSQRVGLCAGTYYVTITDRDGQGISTVHEVVVTEPDPITATFTGVAPSSFTSCNGEVLIDVEGTVGPVVYTWIGSQGHTGNNQRAEGLCASEVVTFFVTDDNGCSAELQQIVSIPADGCFQASPVLTPGTQDGKNDFLEFSCIEQSPKNSVEIYNRSGQLVYQAENYNNGSVRWEGLKNGEPLAEGVYFFVLRYTGSQSQEQVVKGHINLLR